jgi:predicted ATP-grasp superfamily ATP-dependent carboligase
VRIGLGEEGLCAGGVMAALQAVSRRDRIAGVVVGSGFEGQPELLARVGERHRLIGNAPDVVRAVKDPRTFFGRLSSLGIPHPEVRFREAVGTGRWLLKRIGGAGGAHVQPVNDGRGCGPGYYLQRHVAGRACSALFLADGRVARVVGYNETWDSREDPSSPYRYAGGMSLSALPARLARELGDALRELVYAFELRGLCGVDFVLEEGGGWMLLEVNPRPTASFELHGPTGALWEAHLRACSGRLAPLAWTPSRRKAVAQRVLYASHPIRVPHEMRWPCWSRDRPRPGTLIGAGHPVCTITASASKPDSVRRLIGVRSAALEHALGFATASSASMNCD